MRIETLAKVVHENAVAHGWWDEDRELPEIVALIHSEWSEALEEARAGRPLVYRNCIDCDDGPCEVTADTALACGYHDPEGKKPEGIAVELIDGVIRILDALGKAGATFQDPETGLPAEFESLYDEEMQEPELTDHLPTLIALLHAQTSDIFSEDDGEELPALVAPMATALTWIKNRGLDPLALLMEKHEYNARRPYKHGKKF